MKCNKTVLQARGLMGPGGGLRAWSMQGMVHAGHAGAQCYTGICSWWGVGTQRGGGRWGFREAAEAETAPLLSHHSGFRVRVGVCGQCAGRGKWSWSLLPFRFGLQAQRRYGPGCFWCNCLTVGRHHLHLQRGLRAHSRCCLASGFASLLHALRPFDAILDVLQGQGPQLGVGTGLKSGNGGRGDRTRGGPQGPKDPGLKVDRVL